MQVGNSDFTALGLDANGDIFTLPSRFEFSPTGHQDAAVTPAAITSASHGGTSAFLPSGAFVTASTVTIIRRTDLDVQVQRFNADGTSASASTAFDYAGTSGLVTRDTGAAVAVQANGQAVTAGSHAESTQTTQTSVFGLARVNADGSLDAGFGGGGVLTTKIQGNDSRARAAHPARRQDPGHRRLAERRGRDQPDASPLPQPVRGPDRCRARAAPGHGTSNHGRNPVCLPARAPRSGCGVPGSLRRVLPTQPARPRLPAPE